MTKNKKKSSSNRLFKNVILFISGTIIIFLLSYFVGIEDLITSLKRIPPLVLIGLFLMQIATMVMLCFISYKLIKKIIPDLNFKSMWNIHLIVTFVENVTPGAKIGGEFIKIYLLKKDYALEYSKLIIAGVVQKFITMTPFIFLSAICLLYLSKVEGATHFIKISMYVSGALISMIGIFILIIIFSNSIKNQRFFLTHINSECAIEKNTYFKNMPFLEKKIESISKISTITKSFGTINEIIFLLSIAFIIWILYPIKIYIIAHFLGFDIGFISLTVAVFIAFLIGTIPLFPGGLGTFEATMAGILTLFGLPLENGIILALISRTVTFWFPIAFTLIPSLNTLFNLKDKQ